MLLSDGKACAAAGNNTNPRQAARTPTVPAPLPLTKSSFLPLLNESRRAYGGDGCKSTVAVCELGHASSRFPCKAALALFVPSATPTARRLRGPLPRTHSPAPFGRSFRL